MVGKANKSFTIKGEWILAKKRKVRLWVALFVVVGLI